MYKITEEAHQKIFEEKIKPSFLSKASSVDFPVAVILGGQPGSGKSTLIELVTEDLLDQGGAVFIAGDNFREYHSRYKELLELGHKDAAFLTNEDVGRWVEKAMLYSGQMRYNIVMEGTMRTPDNVVNMLNRMHDAGYKSDVRVLAVNERISWQRVLSRYENEYIDLGYGRMVVPQVHADAYTGLLKTLDQIEQNRLADRLVVYKPDATILYDNELRHGEWNKPPQARAIVEQERSRSWTLPERLEYAKGFDELLEMLQYPQRGASVDEINAVKTLREQAYQELEVIQKRMDRLHKDPVEEAIKKIKTLRYELSQATILQKPMAEKALQDTLKDVANNSSLAQKIAQREPDIGNQLEKIKGLEIGQDIER